MRKHRLLIVVSALSLASFSVGTQAFAREAEPRDDRGNATLVASDDRRGGPQAEVGEHQGWYGHGADDDAAVGDDRGVDVQPDARHGADDPAGDDRGVDSQPHN